MDRKNLVLSLLMAVTTASVVGIPSKTTWSTTAAIRRDQGEILCAAGFTGDERAPHEGRRFIRFLEELEIVDAAQFYQEVRHFVGVLQAPTAYSIALVLVVEEKLTLFTFGYGLIGLIRADQARWVMDGTQAAQVLEGQWQFGEQIVLSTARGRELQIPLVSWRGAEPADATADIFAKVQGHDHSGEVAVLIAQRTEKAHGVGAATEAETSPQPEPPSPSPKQPVLENQSSSYLISPEKLAAGIQAASVDPAEIKKHSQWSGKSWQKMVEKLRFEQLHLVRAGLVGGVVLILLGSLFAYRSWNVKKEYAAVITPLEELVRQTQSISDEERFRKRQEAKSVLERLQATRVSYGQNQAALDSLIQTTEGLYQALSGEERLVNLPIFYDFRLVAADFLAQKVDREKEQAFFLDPAQKKVIAVNLQSKQNTVLSFEEAPDDLKDVAIQTAQVFALSPQTLSKVRATGGDFANLLSLGDSVKGPELLEEFADQLYVYDRSAEQIWRVAAEEGASPSAWVRSARGIDFAQMSSLSIDGSIWLGSRQGDIYKLERGERVDFAVNGVPEPFTASLLLATVEDGQKLVVIEPSKQRLVIIDKATGDYQKQIFSEHLGAITDVFLDETEQNAYLLGGSVVYKVGI